MISFNNNPGASSYFQVTGGMNVTSPAFTICCWTYFPMDPTGSASETIFSQGQFGIGMSLQSSQDSNSFWGPNSFGIKIGGWTHFALNVGDLNNGLPWFVAAGYHDVDDQQIIACQPGGTPLRATGGGGRSSYGESDAWLCARADLSTSHYFRHYMGEFGLGSFNITMEEVEDIANGADMFQMLGSRLRFYCPFTHDTGGDQHDLIDGKLISRIGNPLFTDYGVHAAQVLPFDGDFAPGEPPPPTEDSTNVIYAIG